MVPGLVDELRQTRARWRTPIPAAPVALRVIGGCRCVLFRTLSSWDAFFFFSSRRRHTRFDCDWSSDVCSSDLWLRTKLETIPVSKTRYERLSVPMQKAVVSGINRFAVALHLKKAPLARQERDQIGRAHV